MTTYETLLVENHDAVRVIRFNRPQALNAFSNQLMDEMTSALDAAFAEKRKPEFKGR